MILWIFKLIKTVRRAIAGRKYPHQLAWAVAFGLLLGIVPHGNLLALGLLILVLSLQINHAMAGLTAIAASFAATRLDPFSHQVGDYLLGHPEVAPWATAAWQLPLVPWTDLNNTVVLGSLTIGVLCLVPTFLVTYPVFRLFAPAAEKSLTEEVTAEESAEQAVTAEAPPATAEHSVAVSSDSQSSTVSPPIAHQVVLIDRRHQHISAPRRNPAPQRSTVGSNHSAMAASRHAAIDEAVKFTEVTDSGQTDSSRSEPAVSLPKADSPEESSVELPSSDQEPQEVNRQDHRAAAPKKLRTVETRIDVILMKDHRSADEKDEPSSKPSADNEPMDEALNYLLRQLRDSQQRKAA